MADAARCATGPELLLAVSELIEDVEEALRVPPADRGAFYGPYLETLVALVNARLVNVIATCSTYDRDDMRRIIVAWRGPEAAAKARLRRS